MKADTRVPAPFTDAKGTPCFKVPVDDEGNLHALIEQEDYQRLVGEYGATPVWHCTGNGGRRRYVALSLSLPDEDHSLMPVARLVMGARAKERVFYCNNDTLDLRRSNLETRRGGGRALHDAVPRVLAAKQHREAVAATKTLH